MSSFTNACQINPHLEISGDNQQVVEIVWWTNFVVLPSISLLGLMCNLLNLFVLFSNESARRMPSWHLLVSLAIFDILFLIFATLEIMPPGYLSAAGLLVHTRVVLYIRTLASTFYKASILIVIAFNIERYICVCRPMIAHRIDSRTNKVAIISSLAIGLICSVQWPLVYRVTECEPKDVDVFNIDEPSYAIIALHESAHLRAYYKLLDGFSLIFFNVFPIVLLSILNFHLVVTLRKVIRRDSSVIEGSSADGYLINKNTIPLITSAVVANDNDNRNQRSTNANAMLFAVVLLLFVCIGPQAPARLLYDYFGERHRVAVLYICISQQMVFLNASLNFLVYCLVSKKYRTFLRESVRRILKTSPSSESPSSESQKTHTFKLDTI